jgi:hypothetical protein
LETILSGKILDLAGTPSTTDKQLSALEVAKAREELFRWNQRLNGPMSNTCEQIADDARLEYLSSRMVENEDGSKIWETFEDYLAEPDQPLALTARFQVMLYLQGMEADFLDNTPEAVAMREVEDELTSIAKEIAKKEVIAEEEKAAAKPKPKKAKKKPGPKKASTRKKKVKE